MDTHRYTLKMELHTYDPMGCSYVGHDLPKIFRLVEQSCMPLSMVLYQTTSVANLSFHCIVILNVFALFCSFLSGTGLNLELGFTGI